MSNSASTPTPQRKTLSAKKGSTKGLKNVLATPHENYWPILKHDYGAALENLLKRLLPVLKRVEIKVPWSQLRKMNKEEKLAAKKAAQIESNANYDKEAAKSIVFGINAVTRQLEKDNTSCILLEAGVDPSLLVKHVLVMAQNKNVPVLLISFMKRVTLETIGFASAALGLKKDAEESVDNYFHELFKKVSELSAELPKRKSSVALFQNDDSIVEDKPEEIQMSFLKMEEDIESPKSSASVSTDVYLYRTSKKERVFQPDSSVHSKPSMNNKWTEFIGLSDEKCEVKPTKLPSRFFGSLDSNCDNEIQNHKRKKTSDGSDSDEQSNEILYKPLKVKRLQGNESRKKATKLPKAKKKKK